MFRFNQGNSMLLSCSHSLSSRWCNRGAYNSIASFAVPFFFILSGFYLYNENVQIDLISKKIVRAARMCTYSTVFYLILDLVFFAIENHQINFWIKKVFNLKVIIKFLLFNDLSIIHAGHLWYMFALLYIYIVYYLFVKIMRGSIGKEGLYISFILLLVKIALYKINFNWHYTENWLITGIPLMMIGFLIAKFNFRYSIKVSYLVCLLSFILLMNYFDYDCLSLLGSIFLAGVIFVYGLLNEYAGCESLSLFGRSCSQYVYIIHVAIGRVIVYLSNFLEAVRYRQTMIYFITLIVTCMLSIMMAYFSRYTKKKERIS